MDQRTFPTLVDAWATVPDPRKRWGQRDPWIFLRTHVAAALARGQQHGRASTQGVPATAAVVERPWRGHEAITKRGIIPATWGCPLGRATTRGRRTAATRPRR